MSKVFIPAGYKTPLSVYEMQRAIEFIKSNFQVNLGQAWNALLPSISPMWPPTVRWCILWPSGNVWR